MMPKEKMHRKKFQILLLIAMLFFAACTPAAATEALTSPQAEVQVSSAQPTEPAFAAPFWETQLSSAVNTAPFIAGDFVVAATADGVIHAVRADSGDSAWTFSPQTKVWDSSVNGDETRVCAGMEGGQVTCLDTLTGQQIWTADLGLEVQSRLAVTSDRVYAPTTLAGSGLTNDFDGQASLFALDSLTGETVWESVTDNYILRRPVVNGETIISGGAYQVDGQPAGTVASRIYAVNLTDGSIRWEYKSEDGLVRWVESEGDVVAFSAATEIIYALSLNDGKLLWQFGPGYWMQFPAMKDGKILFGSGDENFQSLDSSTGKQVWEYAINMSALNQVGRPLIQADRIWFNSVTGEIYALNFASGEQIQHLITGKSSRVGGALFDNFYILGDPEGNLYAFTVQ
ncbi:MAG: PQQ-binding-like beta-propeller repeat protein [Chloroflexi bacterium]|nr:PQQ-binding-like beta-propeller repeat protein [Chloroflexota bacterium]